METNLEKNPLKGQALIALAAAAGVVVASRLSRTGLALTAGLAWHLWNSRKDHPVPVPATQPEKTPPPVTNPPAPLAPQQEADLPTEAEPMMEPAAVLPAPVEDTHSPAWDDLRAALAPSLETITVESPPGPAAPEAETTSAAGEPEGSFSPLKPILTDFQPFPATDPWIESTEPMPPPADERPALPEPEPPDFIIDPEEPPPTPAAETTTLQPTAPGTTTLLPRPLLPPNIIARPESGSQPSPLPMASSPGLIMPSSQQGHEENTGHSGDEDKKSFFDWLRS